MSHPEINAIVIGFKSTAEIDEAIQRVDRNAARVNNQSGVHW